MLYIKCMKDKTQCEIKFVVDTPDQPVFIPKVSSARFLKVTISAINHFSDVKFKSFNAKRIMFKLK